VWPSRREAPGRGPGGLVKPQAPRPSTGGRLIYAIGDIHGRSDLLKGLIGRVLEDMGASARAGDPPCDKPVVVFLGDYIDRGADSRGVVDAILALRGDPSLEVRCLKGNHEQALLEFLEDTAIGPSWMIHGGRQTLASYGVATHGIGPGAASAEGWAKVRDALANALAGDQLAFYRSLELSATYGDYLFVHAGVRPGVPLDRQSAQDMMWIRHDFIEGSTRLDKLVVHGHTPGEAPYVDFRRICVDTGAYATGILSAVRLCGEEQSFIQERSR
jgi:serine/threonine protein phosphatase 1